MGCIAGGCGCGGGGGGGGDASAVGGRSIDPACAIGVLGAHAVDNSTGVAVGCDERSVFVCCSELVPVAGVTLRQMKYVEIHENKINK